MKKLIVVLIITGLSIQITKAKDVSDTIPIHNPYVNLQVMPLPSVSLSGSVVVCKGIKTIIHAKLTGSSPWNLAISDGFNIKNHIILSSSNETIFDTLVAPLVTTIYTIISMYDNFCSAEKSDSNVIITVNPLPEVSFKEIPHLCVTDLPVIFIDSSGLYIGKGVTGNCFVPKLAGIGEHSITYSVINSNGCTNDVSQTLIVNKLPDDQLLLSSVEICKGSSGELFLRNSEIDVRYQLRSMPNNINVGNSVSGNGFDIAFRVNPFITTQYNILAATLNECSIQLKNMASVIVNNCTVKMVNATGLIIPEGFSPDGDNINDYFEIKGIENYPNAEISIYNRWGTLIYSKKPYFNEWDGISSITKKMLPVGTYYYILNLKNRMKSIAGWIYLNKE